MARLLTRLSISALAVLGLAAPSLAFEAPSADAAAPAEESVPAPGTEGEPATAAGQDLDLHAVLEVFKESQNVEDFETRLNDPDAGVVNLDLNGDEEVDFVGVFEEIDGEVHVLFLRAFISEKESQDIASIELERKGEDVTVQVVGDPGIYGPDYIVEPDLGEESALPSRLAVQPAIEPVVIASADASWWPRFSKGEDGSFDLAAVIVVRTWPTVTVIYTTGYRRYYSPYRWRRYPSYYRARRPVARHNYRHRNRHYRQHHHRTTHRQSTRASNVYSNKAVTSPSVPKASTAAGARPQATPSNKATPSAKPSQKPTTTQKTPTKSHTPSRAGPSPGGGSRRGGAAPRRR